MYFKVGRHQGTSESNGFLNEWVTTDSFTQTIRSRTYRMNVLLGNAGRAAPLFCVELFSLAELRTRCKYCRAKAKDCNFDFCRKWVIDVFGTFKTSFIMYRSILSQFSFSSKKIMGRLNRNFKKPQRNQGRTLYNTSNRSFTLFGTLKMSYAFLPLFTRASIWSYGASLKLYGVLPFFTVH